MSRTRPKIDAFRSKPLQLRVLSDLKKELKSRAAIEGLSMEEWLHRTLCNELGRQDLLAGPSATRPVVTAQA